MSNDLYLQYYQKNNFLPWCMAIIKIKLSNNFFATSATCPSLNRTYFFPVTDPERGRGFRGHALPRPLTVPFYLYK